MTGNRKCLLAVLLVVAGALVVGAAELPGPVPGLTRLTGFNLTLGRHRDNPDATFDERDFALIREWGFNFVRLALDCDFWCDPKDRRVIRDDAFGRIDRGVALARKYGLHVMFCMHRAPGWCSVRPYEDPCVFTDAATMETCARHWAYVARHYRDVPVRDLSFNLFNEPPDWLSDAAYARVVRRMLKAVREIDARRIVCVDGIRSGKRPPLALMAERPPNVIYAMRGYEADPDAVFEAWKGPLADGHRVVMGEFAVEWRVPHAEALARVGRYLELMRSYDVSWAWWEIRGGFGVLRSCRKDAALEDFRGEKLDRKMLDLLQGDCRNRNAHQNGKTGKETTR